MTICQCDIMYICGGKANYHILGFANSAIYQWVDTSDGWVETRGKHDLRIIRSLARIGENFFKRALVSRSPVFPLQSI